MATGAQSLSFVYPRRRRELGRPARFKLVSLERPVDTLPDEELQAGWRTATYREAAVQAAAPMAVHEAQTADTILESRQTTGRPTSGYASWPAPCLPGEGGAGTRASALGRPAAAAAPLARPGAAAPPPGPEDAARARARVERDEDYLRTVLRLVELASPTVAEAGSFDAGAEYDRDESDLDAPAAGIREVFAARPRSAGASRVPAFGIPGSAERPGDPGHGPRPGPVTALAWAHDGSARVAVAHGAEPGARGGEGEEPGSGRGGVCGAVHDASRPDARPLVLPSACALTALAFNPRDAGQLAVGDVLGGLAIFDPRAPANSARADPAHVHEGGVAGLAWTQSRTNSELVAAGQDGCLRWWDARQLGRPLEELTLTGLGGGGATPATCLEHASAAPTRLLVGCPTGAVFGVSRAAAAPSAAAPRASVGRGRPPVAHPLAKVACVHRHPHAVPVVALARCAPVPKAFLSAAGSQAYLWFDDVATPLACVTAGRAGLTAAVLSPARAGLALLGDAAGEVAAWDLSRSRSAPVARLRAGAGAPAITALRWSPAPELAACGDAGGGVRVLRLDGWLGQASSAARDSLAAALEREAVRERAAATVAGRGARDAAAGAREAARPREGVREAAGGAGAGEVDGALGEGFTDAAGEAGRGGTAMSADEEPLEARLEREYLEELERG